MYFFRMNVPRALQHIVLRSLYLYFAIKRVINYHGLEIFVPVAGTVTEISLYFGRDCSNI